MPVESEYQLYDFDPVGAGLVAAVRAGQDSAVTVSPKFPLNATNTPRIAVVFTSGSAKDSSKLLVPSIEAKLQPRNAYEFSLTCEIVTQRELNGGQHSTIVAKARMALQLYRLNAFGKANPELWPFHCIGDIIELSPSVLSTVDEDTTDSTTLTFSGWFFIDPGAWPVPAPIQPQIEGEFLTPDSSQFFVTPDTSRYFQQPS